MLIYFWREIPDDMSLIIIFHVNKDTFQDGYNLNKSYDKVIQKSLE